VKAIMESLWWLGLQWNEGPDKASLRQMQTNEDFEGAPDIGGPYGPYVQSLKVKRHQAAAEELIALGKAYRCDCTAERLDQMRKEQMARKESTHYDRHCRFKQPGEVDPKQPHVVRLAVPLEGSVVVHDLIRGDITVDYTRLDDFVILKSDGFPTYHLAAMVDDHDMHISHVLRGEEHINNTPRQINLYRALGWTSPQFGHLPLILAPDGSKLSKRHGAVSVLQYDEDGFLPEALFNYLARLGWSHGDEEKFTREQLIEWFDLQHVNRAPAQYNLDKLLWLNGEYIKEADDDRLASLVSARVEARGGRLADGPPLPGVISLLKDRSRTLNELADAALLFYSEPQVDIRLLSEHLNDSGRQAVRTFRDRASALTWERSALHGTIKQIVSELKLKMPQVAGPLRVAVTGRTQTPSIDAVLELIGRDKVLERIDRAAR
jgi:glutamyl-tRNA synthetase